MIINVLLVDDQPLVRDGIAALLSTQPEIRIIGEAANGRHACRLVPELNPDVVLMDVRPSMNSLEAIEQISTKYPFVKTIVLTAIEDETCLLEALSAGVSGYLLKNLSAPEIACAIQATFSGTCSLEPSLVEKLVNKAQQCKLAQTDSTTRFNLTRREIDVLEYLATGATNGEIADSLGISKSTVKSHVSNILTRLNLRNRVQAMLYAREHGWV